MSSPRSSPVTKAQTALMVSQLSKEQTHEFRLAFNQLDSDGDGLITAGELRAAIRSLGQTGEDTEDIIARFDEEKQGGLNFDNFLSLIVLKLFNNNMEGEVRAFFAFFDVNKAGRVNIEDLRHCIRTVRQGVEINGMKKESNRLWTEFGGELSTWANLCNVIAGDQPLTEMELETMMADADVDGDGALDFSEFERALMRNSSSPVKREEEAEDGAPISLSA